MPLAVVGTAQQAAVLGQELYDNGNAFTVTQVADRAAAEELIRTRKACGAIVMPTTKRPGTQVLTASAASPVASQALTGLAARMGQAQARQAAARKQAAATKAATLGAQAAAAKASLATLQKVAANTPGGEAALYDQIQSATVAAQQAGAKATAAQKAAQQVVVPQVTVTDVVPLGTKDSRGAGLAVSALPIAMGGMIGGVLVSLLVVGWRQKLVAVAGYGVLGGLAMTVVLHSWFGFVSGNFGLVWLDLGLALAATASVITAFQSLLGGPGIGIGAVITMFIGNPLSGMNMPQEWLPGAWGNLGQLLVPGAAGTLLRLESYFPDAGTARYWITLVFWLVLGCLLTLLGHRNSDETVHIEGATRADDHLYAPHDSALGTGATTTGATRA